MQLKLVASFLLTFSRSVCRRCEISRDCEAEKAEEDEEVLLDGLLAKALTCLSTRCG